MVALSWGVWLTSAGAGGAGGAAGAAGAAGVFRGPLFLTTLPANMLKNGPGGTPKVALGPWALGPRPGPWALGPRALGPGAHFTKIS